jgi:hypothetical protein
MTQKQLSKRKMIGTFYIDHQHHHTEDAQVFIDNLIVAGIGAGWIEDDRETNTVTWLGVTLENEVSTL